MAEPIFKVGDIVTIKKLTHDDHDLYRFGLNDSMIELSGVSLEIIDIEDISASPGKIPDDGWRYKLKGGGGWSWASSMFEDSRKSPVSSITEGSGLSDSNIDAFIKKNVCPILDFTL